MLNKKARVFFTIILIILLLALIFLTYLLYQYIPGKPEEFRALIEKPKLEVDNLSYKVRQFYPNMKFNHNELSYKIDSACSEEKKERVIKAFSELENKVEVINFYSKEKEEDIEISCSVQTEKLPKEEKDFFIAGEGGARNIIQTARYNVITEGIILLHESSRKAIECEWPNVELHELLHVFGFEHSQDENSLMYYVLESCDQKLDESIIQDLKKLYLQENLADLYFEDIVAIKKGIYLDFNVTVKNSGTIDAEKVVLAVYDEDEEIENFELKNILFGAGITFQVTNLKLKSRGSKNIEIKIDPVGSIREIDEENNVAKLEFG